jgi:hypothetical protein
MGRHKIFIVTGLVIITLAIVLACTSGKKNTNFDEDAVKAVWSEGVRADGSDTPLSRRDEEKWQTFPNPKGPGTIVVYAKSAAWLVQGKEVLCINGFAKTFTPHLDYTGVELSFDDVEPFIENERE